MKKITLHYILDEIIRVALFVTGAVICLLMATLLLQFILYV